MTEQLSEIGGRLKALRDLIDIPAEKMAQEMKLSVGEYLEYENGEKDFSFSFLYNAAGILGVDVVDIISGESPKLTVCALVRKGEGYDIMRRAAYDYKHLAFTFSKKKAEPFMVTVEPSENELTLHCMKVRSLIIWYRAEWSFTSAIQFTSLARATAYILIRECRTL